MAATRVRKPRRHRPLLRYITDGVRIRPHLSVGLKRHGRHFTLPMATLAAGLQNGQDIPVKRGSIARRSGAVRQRGRNQQA